MSKDYDGERARDNIAKRIIKHGDHHNNGERVSSEKAFERAKQIVQDKDRRDRERK